MVFSVQASSAISVLWSLMPISFYNVLLSSYFLQNHCLGWSGRGASGQTRQEDVILGPRALHRRFLCQYLLSKLRATSPK